MFNRRKFIKQSAILSCAPMMPRFVSSSLKNIDSGQSGKVLIVVQLSGGNDGLNTVVPFGDDKYYLARPTMGIRRNELIELDDRTGFNRALKAIYPLYMEGEMTILNHVGYPNPNRSHFRSMDIWQTGGSSDEYLSSGWIGRYLDSECVGCDRPYHAIEWGDNLSLALQGEQRMGFAMRGLSKLKRTADDVFLNQLGSQYVTDGNDTHLDFLYKTMTEVQESAAYIVSKSKKNRSVSSYPDHAFGVGLKQIAELILAGCDTQIYYIQISGFDTHVNQKARQGPLLRTYAEGIRALTQDLKNVGIMQDVLIMTFSEFGRRVEENASRGTDHGAGNTLFLMGGGLKKPGMYNDGPDLANLLDGDLAHQIDFRSVYANILEDWIGTGYEQVLPKAIPKLDVV
ncbi:MAG: DUF1501 domain-containing protein [Saprospiraceae bacterium]|nr:DUF1501 domain-containing protein [Saprospiraceae bacterium]